MNDPVQFSTAKIEGLARSIEAIMDAENPSLIIGTDLTKLAARIPSEQQVTPGAVVRLSLLNDTLCVAERAIKTDGLVSATWTRPTSRVFAVFSSSMPAMARSLAVAARAPPGSGFRCASEPPN